MAEVTLVIGGRRYEVNCRDGEEEHLRRLAYMVDTKAAQARLATPGLTEVRQLLFAAIFLADEVHDYGQKAAASGAPALSDEDEQLAHRIDKMSERIESLATRLAHAGEPS